MIKTLSRLLPVLLSMLTLSGCASLKASQHAITPNMSSNNTPSTSYALPADYELPPYIRIVSLPLVSDTPSVSENAVLLGDYWLFANTGYTVSVAALPSAEAGAAYLNHTQLNPNETQLIRRDTDTIVLVAGLHQTHKSARSALKSINQPGARVIALRELKAMRCQTPASDTLSALCAGTPVKTLRIAEVDS